ncbi:MAG: Gfo/Idh/MocA family oxidoreductase, partial [Phycisphaerales bacterium]
MTSDDKPAEQVGDLTRRDFVKTTAAVVSAGSLAMPAFAHAAGSDEIRVGLIGCGGRGTGAARDALKADPGVVLTAMGDVFADRVEASLKGLQGLGELAERVRVNPENCFSGFDNYKQVIDSGVDVVILTTPPVFRPIHLDYAVQAGKHIFCEKPVAVDAPGIRAVLQSVADAKRQGLSLVSGLCWRYSMPQRATYARLLEGAIGDVRAMQTTYNTGTLGDAPRKPEWSDVEWQLRNWKAFTWAGGDHIVEQAVHAIDWMAWAMNDEPPTRAFAVGGRQCRGGEWTGNMYDHFGVIYEYANGARGYHMCRQIDGCSHDNTAYFLGTKGTCSSNPWGPTQVIEGENPWRYEGPNPSMYQVEHDELFASIRSGEPINDGVRMSHSTLLGILGRMAAYTGQTITWEQAMNS